MRCRCLTVVYVASMALGSCGGEVGGDAPGTPLVEPFRATPPLTGSPRPFTTPEPQRFTLANGMRVILVERHTLPLVNWQLLFPGGDLSDPMGKEGRAALCTAVLIQGGAPDGANRLADMASRLSSSNRVDQLVLNGFSLRSQLDRTIALWAELLRMPGMTLVDLDFYRRRNVTSLLAPASPSLIASRLLSIAARGEGHPYARLPTEASYNAVGVEDCRQYRDDHFRPEGAMLLVAGDVSRAEVEQKFSTMLPLPGAGKPLPPVPPPMPRSARILFADAPGATQATVVMWASAAHEKAADAQVASVMTSIFAGDSVSSRLGLVLREMKGVAYSISGATSSTRTDALLTVRVPVEAGSASLAIEEILRAAASMRQTEVTADELRRERDGRILGLPQRFATAIDALSAFATLAYFDLPDDHYQQIPQQLMAIDAVTLRAAAETYLAPDRLRFVVVGDARQTLPALRVLVGSGILAGEPLQVVNATGRVVP